MRFARTGSANPVRSWKSCEPGSCRFRSGCSQPGAPVKQKARHLDDGRKFMATGKHKAFGKMQAAAF